MCYAHRFSITINNQAFNCWAEREIHKNSFGKVIDVLKLWNSVSRGTDLDISHKCLLWGKEKKEKDIVRAREGERERCEGKMKMGERALYHSVWQYDGRIGGGKRLATKTVNMKRGETEFHRKQIRTFE